MMLLYKDQALNKHGNLLIQIIKFLPVLFDRFKQMIKGSSYKMLLNHKDHKINEIFFRRKKAIFEVIVMDNEKNIHMFKWQVEKYSKSGPLENCWLTTVVSAPIPLGSSI